MAHKRHGRRALGWTDALPFIVGAIILVAVPLLILLSLAASRYASAISGVSTSAAVSSPAAASATPAPTSEATPEPEEAVSRYAAVGLTEEDAYILACLVYHEARASRSRDKPPSSRSCLTVASPTSSRIRSRRSYFRNTATFGSSPPLPIYTRRSRARHSIARSCTHTTPRSLSSRRRPCFSPRVHITSTLPLSSEIIIFAK